MGEHEGKPTRQETRGMAWWNAMSDADRAYWLRIAGSATPADAWAQYQAEVAEFADPHPDV